MNRLIQYSLLAAIGTTVLFSCVTKKKRGETSGFGKFYHNTTAYYNGYWNAKEIYRESMLTLRLASKDDYNKILEVEDFVSVDNPKMVKAEMDKIIEKVTTVAQLHQPSDWVDDCYVLMAKAQYMKQEYETAEETLTYFQEDFNPSNPYGRNYKSKKPTGKAAKKAREAERKEQEKERKEQKKVKEEVREEKAKTKKEEREEKAKERERARKEREKQRKENAKNRKKGTGTTAPDKPAGGKSLPGGGIQKDSLKNTMNAPAGSSEKNQEEEEAIKPPKPKKPQPDKTAYSEGLLWLAKTYIKRENWFSSQMILEKLSNSPVNDEIRSELPSTFASLYIKQKRYTDAISKLQEAIEEADNRQLRARYSFIAGQLAQIEGSNSDALRYFSNARKYATDPTMEFMSEMAVAKNGLISGSKSKKEILAELERMLKEDKYKQLVDQIYFTLGDIEYNENKYTTAIDYYKKSAKANTGDQKLKAESYYKIADIFYNTEKYREAALYFDSTLAVLPRTDERLSRIQKYAANLKDIAFNMDLIDYQDTLLYFATLSDEEKKKVIPPWLERNKNKNVQQNVQPGGIISKQVVVKSNADFGNSSFFAYNKVAKERGREDFEKIWGRRNLEDDWRRSSRSTLSNNEDADKEDKVAEDDSKAEKFDKEAYGKFVKDLPSNPVAKQEANDKIMNAMFTLGKLFRDRIENFASSADVLEKMHGRYGSTPYELDSYFYLYLDYEDLQNREKAQFYKNALIRKFPDSKYAAILSDPEYFNKNKLQVNKAELFYKNIYTIFEKGDYKRALESIDQSVNTLGEENSYASKMALLRAMCLGNLQGKEAYVNALNELVNTYPGTPEQLKAKEIIRFLGGDKGAFDIIQDVDKIFQREENTVHYVAVITYDLEETKHVNLKVAISEYNKKNFKNERLQLGDASLNVNDNSQIILIRKFDTETKALAYYQKVIKDAEDFTGKVDFPFDVFAISQANYRKMLSERSSSAYRSFFENSILGTKDK